MRQNLEIRQHPEMGQNPYLSGLNYALVHEWLTPKATGGSELVVQEILGCVDADLYALIDFESRNPESYLYKRSIGHTFLQHFPRAENGVQKYLPLMPLAIEQLDLREYDVILSSSHAVAKGVLTRAEQVHICYCHAPMRYAWDLTFDYLGHGKAGKGVKGALTRYLLHRLRQWDVLSANRVDHFIANSQTTAHRIWRCYRREAEVIYPPVAIDRFTFSAQKQDYYLVVSRLVGYKQVGLIVDAFNQLGLPLLIIGEGPDQATLEAKARSNIQFLGWRSNEEVATYMSQAKAFVYAAYEDFGIAPVEAQACGTPVIAYGKGGTSETVKDFRIWGDRGTGILFERQELAAVVAVVQQFEAQTKACIPEVVRHHAQQFSADTFKVKYLETIDRICQKTGLGTKKQ
jgi:glycosyltransferase involved in cell wall biosynthesis